MMRLGKNIRLVTAKSFVRKVSGISICASWHSVVIESQRWLVKIRGLTCIETTINLRVCERPDEYTGSRAAVRWNLTGHIANLSALQCLSSRKKKAGGGSLGSGGR